MGVKSFGSAEGVRGGLASGGGSSLGFRVGFRVKGVEVHRFSDSDSFNSLQRLDSSDGVSRMRLRARKCG